MAIDSRVVQEGDFHAEALLAVGFGRGVASILHKIEFDLLANKELTKVTWFDSPGCPFISRCCDMFLELLLRSY